jgi:hypothetical protein
MQWWDIKNLKKKDFMLSLWGALFLVLPGIVAIIAFNQDLLFKLNWAILILLSAAIMFPFVVLNTVAALVCRDVKPNDEEGLFYSFFLSAFITGFAAYAIIAISYYNHYHIGLIVEISIIAEFLLIIFLSIYDNARTRRKKHLKDKKRAMSKMNRD